MNFQELEPSIGGIIQVSVVAYFVSDNFLNEFMRQHWGLA